MFVDAYARLVAMKLFALRAADYMRVRLARGPALPALQPDGEDEGHHRRARTSSTCSGTSIAAKGFEKDMYFEQAAADIRGLPKLEGTVHVNIALIVKFMPNFFFAPADCPAGPAPRRRRQRRLPLRSGRRHGASAASASTTTARPSRRSICPTCSCFAEQVEAFRELLASAPPDEAQMKDIDFLLAGGELFALVVYAQLILENARIYGIDPTLVDQIFDFMVRDFASSRSQLHEQGERARAEQMALLPADDPQAGRTTPRATTRVWNETVLPLNGRVRDERVTMGPDGGCWRPCSPGDVVRRTRLP